MVRYALAGDLLDEMSRNWWVVVLRGLAAVLFGVVALVWPDRTLVVLAVVFGVYALAEGAALGYAAYRSAPGTRAPLAAQAALSVVVGLVALLWPLAAILALVFVIGLWAVLTGVAEIVTAIRLRAHISSEWLLVFVGALSVVFGLLLWFWPLAGAGAVMFVVAMYALIFGAVLTVAGFRLRGAADAFLSEPEGDLPRPHDDPLGDEPYRPWEEDGRAGEQAEDHGGTAEWREVGEEPPGPEGEDDHGGRHRAPGADGEDHPRRSEEP
ncbi:MULTISPECIES: HdeD family acid-resistance protein [unclassified Nocardiopsis]|uniref:HdeD family acid-resistance protein n=1 Tax=unclassified Nocardiopsis TaxID=2649073 RepID=UPI0013572721|nr:MULTISPECIES: HdeD family acid-resistance protein [unclassified Nocardiopsis]